MIRTYLILFAILYVNNAFTQDKSWEDEKLLVYNQSSVSHIISAHQIF